MESKIIKKSQENATFIFSVYYLTRSKCWKVSLNSDGQPFHQYQQNEQPPISITHWTQTTTQYDVGNLCPGLIHTHQNVTGVSGGSL